MSVRNVQQLVVAYVLAAFALPAAAQEPVTLCVSDTQAGSGRNLAAALAAGGRVRFACPGGSATIEMTTGHTVPPGTVVDGGGAITLDAGGRGMTMFRAASLTLERLSIKAARVAPHPRFVRLSPSVIHASESLRLDGVTIEGSESPVRVTGDAVVIDSAFLGNTGGAMSIAGDARVEDSRFIGNQGGLTAKRGTLRRVVFSQNTGGALGILHPNGRLRVIASRFEGNLGQSAMRLSQRGAGGGAGVVELRRCVFTNNSSTAAGGAISIYDSAAEAPTPAVAQIIRQLPPARLEIFYTRFTRNSAPTGGGIHADLVNGAHLAIRGGIFHENTAVHAGGAILWDGGTVAVTNTLFRANRAPSRAAAVMGRGLANAVWSMANVLVVENVGGPQGGAVEMAGGVVRNVTIARNDTAGFVALGGAAPASIGNSILSQNRGGNCGGNVSPAFAPGNLQHGDASCAGVIVANPHLDSLYVPQLGSVALSSGDPGACAAAPVNAVDMVFQGRARHRCASGAFERPPVRRARIRRD